MKRKLRVAVLGATGVAGQQFLAALAAHPFFEVTCLAASARTAGKPYAEALRDKSGSLGWYAGGSPPPALLALPVREAASLDPARLRDEAEIVFSALESDAAQEIEPLGDIHATPAYRRHLIEVLGRRALTDAVARAQQANPPAG